MKLWSNCGRHRHLRWERRTKIVRVWESGTERTQRRRLGWTLAHDNKGQEGRTIKFQRGEEVGPVTQKVGVEGTRRPTGDIERLKREQKLSVGKKLNSAAQFTGTKCRSIGWSQVFPDECLSICETRAETEPEKIAKAPTAISGIIKPAFDIEREVFNEN